MLSLLRCCQLLSVPLTDFVFNLIHGHIQHRLSTLPREHETNEAPLDKLISVKNEKVFQKISGLMYALFLMMPNKERSAHGHGLLVKLRI